MAQCKVCRHPDRHEIDQALVSGEAYRSVSNRFDTSFPGTARHAQNHLPQELAKEAGEVAQGDNLLAQVQRLQEKAEKAGDHRTSLAAIRELRGLVELLGKLIGQLHQSQTVNLVQAVSQNDPDAMRQDLLTKLAEIRSRTVDRDEKEVGPC